MRRKGYIIYIYTQLYIYILYIYIYLFIYIAYLAFVAACWFTSLLAAGLLQYFFVPCELLCSFSAFIVTTAACIVFVGTVRYIIQEAIVKNDQSWIDFSRVMWNRADQSGVKNYLVLEWILRFDG